MSKLDDISGVARCAAKKTNIDLTDTEVWAWLEGRHPGLLDDVHEVRGCGERLYVPSCIESPRERAQRLDDGEMSVGELAELAGVSEATVRRSRNKKAGENPASLRGA